MLGLAFLIAKQLFVQGMIVKQLMDGFQPATHYSSKQPSRSDTLGGTGNHQGRGSGPWNLFGGGLWNLLGGAALHIVATKLLFPMNKNEGRKLLGLSNALLEIGGANNREKLEQADARIETLQKILSTKELEFNETKVALNEAQAALRDLQEQLGHQRTLLICLCIVFFICVTGLVIAGLCQRMQHMRERHSLLVERNNEREESLKEILLQKIAVTEQQKESLKAANEEQSVQLLNSMRSSMLPYWHQPFMPSLPAAAGIVPPPPVAPAAPIEQE